MRQSPNLYPINSDRASIPDSRCMRREQGAVRCVLHECALCQSGRYQGARVECVGEGVLAGDAVGIMRESSFLAGATACIRREAQFSLKPCGQGVGSG